MQHTLQLALFGIRASLAAVLVAAGSAKLADTPSFAATLTGLGLPAGKPRLVRGLALAIPLLEVGLGLAVVGGLWPIVINGSVLFLMSGFSVVVLVALHKTPHVACRCFGALSDSQFTTRGLARCLLLTASAAAVFGGGNAYSLHFEVPLGAVVLLVVGYLLFAIAVAQAAQTIARVKVRMT